MNLNKILFTLVSAYPKQNIGQATLDIYERLLADVDPELLQTAALRHMAASQWFPTIAELRQAAADIALERDGILPAPAAWGVALSSPRDATPEIRQAVKLTCGDFYNLRMSTTQAADRARFIDAYNEILLHRRRAITDLPEVREMLAAGNDNQERVETGVTNLYRLMTGKGDDHE